MLKVDLHTHSSASDGELTPVQLVQSALDAGVELLAITDHDTLDGYYAAKHLASENFAILPGIELSTQQLGVSVHIVGLNVDPNDTQFKSYVAQQQQARQRRALIIAERLEKMGLSGVTDFVKGLGDALVTRPDIARYLVETSQVKSVKKAFDAYLGGGKRGDVKQAWPSIESAVKSIVDAGGTAVFAHPEAYSITRTKLRGLIDVFVNAGGEAIELPHEQNDFTQYIIMLAKQYQLKISTGSDFHSNKQGWRKLGKVPSVPKHLSPVWENFAV